MDDTLSPTVGSHNETTLKLFPQSVQIHSNKTPKVERETDTMYN